MNLEDPDRDGCDEAFVGDLDQLWLRWANGPAELTGRGLRRALLASFASALHSRWSHGGYHFRFAEEVRRPGSSPSIDASLARTMLQAMLRDPWGEPLALTWRTPTDALDEFLDQWLFFRWHRPYVRRDDVPDWMIPVLQEPWAACVRELVGNAADARAAVLEGEYLSKAWGDHGVLLVLAAHKR